MVVSFALTYDIITCTETSKWDKKVEPKLSQAEWRLCIALCIKSTSLRLHFLFYFDSNECKSNAVCFRRLRLGNRTFVPPHHLAPCSQNRTRRVCLLSKWAGYASTTTTTTTNSLASEAVGSGRSSTIFQAESLVNARYASKQNFHFFSFSNRYTRRPPPPSPPSLLRTPKPLKFAQIIFMPRRVIHMHARPSSPAGRGNQFPRCTITKSV